MYMSYTSSTDEIDQIKVKNIILYHNHEHKQKLELGKKIYEIINNHEVDLDSLRSEYKEALDLYMKKSVKSFPENIEFKPLQLSILEEIEIPTERKNIMGCRKIMW